MTKKKEGIKKRNKKRVVISCFWYTQALYTQNEEKKMIRSRAILIYILLIASSLRFFFCALYARRILFRRIERVAKRETLCKAFLLRERPIPRSDFFLPLSFLFLLSLLFDAFRFERESIEKTSNVKKIRVLSKIVCVREKERESIET